MAHFSYDFLIKITINNQQINRRKSNIRCYSIIVRNGIFTCLAKRLSFLHVTKKADSDYEIIIESLFSCCLFCIHYAIKPFMDLDQLLYFYYTLEQDLSIKRILQWRPWTKILQKLLEHIRQDNTITEQNHDSYIAFLLNMPACQWKSIHIADIFCH